MEICDFVKLLLKNREGHRTKLLLGQKDLQHFDEQKEELYLIRNHGKTAIFRLC